MKTTTTPKKEIKTVITEKIVVSELKIDGSKKISVTINKKLIRTTKWRSNKKVEFRVAKSEVLESEDFITEYPLKKATKEEIEQYRKNGIPSLVVKNIEGMFFTEIPKNFTLAGVRTNLNHKCATCKRLSAASDEKGGCAKVRAKSVGIERFWQIISGIETFNVAETNLLVNECCFYRKCNMNTPKNVED